MIERARCCWLWILSAVAGCAISPRPPCALNPARKPSPPVASSSPSAAVEPLPQYVISPQGVLELLPSERLRRLAPEAPGSDGGYIAKGVRFRSDARGRASVARERGLIDGVRVPARFGGGFLFTSGSSLYYAKNFLGQPKPYFFATATRTNVARVSFGPSFVLVHADDGQRWTLGWPDARQLPLPFPGLLDVAALDDGRALALLESGHARVKAGDAWQPIKTPADAHPFVSVASDGRALWLDDVRGRRWALGKDGELSSISLAEQPLEPPMVGVEVPKDWPLRVTPLERAIDAGVLLDEHTALVEVGGAFARIDLRSGGIVTKTHAVVSSEFDTSDRPQWRPACQLHRVGADVLSVCQRWNRSVVVEDASTQHPRIRFDYFAERHFVGGPNVLLSEGPCDSDKQRSLVACVRQPGKNWIEYDLSAFADAMPKGDPQKAANQREGFVAWLPTASGSVAAVFRKSEDRYHFVDIATRRAQPLEVRREDVGIWNSSWSTIHKHRHIDASGRAALGLPRALRSEEDRLLVRNPGETRWDVVASPPVPPRDVGDSYSCSDVGCRLGPLLSVGWSAVASEPEWAVLPPADGPLLKDDARPVLRCAPIGAAVVERSVQRGQEPREVSLIPGRDWLWNTPGVEISTADAGHGSKTQAKGPRLSASFNDGATPIADLARFSPVGLIKSQRETGDWLIFRQGRFSRFESKRPRFDSPWFRDAVRLPSGDLAVLVEEPDSPVEYVLVLSTASAPSWALPVGPPRELEGAQYVRYVRSVSDALALGPNRELGVLRSSRGGGPPTASEPALLLRAGREPATLAPWSSVQPASAAVCRRQASDWRAIVKTQGSWLRVTGIEGAADGPMIAAVRWDDERVCLEWIRVGGLDLDARLEGEIDVRSGVRRYHGRPWQLEQRKQRLRCALEQPAAGQQ